MSTLLVYYRQDATKQQTNFIIKFTHRPKNQVFRPTEATHCTNSGQTSKGRRAPRSAWLCKISPQSAQGLWMQLQKYQKFPFFGKRVALQRRTPWPISKIFRGFYTPNFPASVFQMWRDLLHNLRSYCWETARLSIRPNFSVHPVGKTMHWIEKWIHIFWWPRRALSPCKVWGRSYYARRL